MASSGCQTGDECRQENSKKQQQEQESDQEGFALRVAEIQGPPQPESLGNKQRRIIGIVVKDSPRPIPLIVAKHNVGALAIRECVRLCQGTLRMPEENEDQSN